MADQPRGIFKIAAAIVLAFVMAVPVGALVGTPRSAKTATSETILRIGFLQKVDSLNPYVGLNDASYEFYGLVYDQLVSVGNHLEPTPNLATSWNAVPLTDPEMLAHPEYPYGSVWQYNLTHNASWGDGEPFTADDVVFNINLNAWNYTTMWSYEPYSFFMKDAVKVDDYTVRIHFRDKITNKPIPAAYAYLISIPMLPKHKLQSMTALQIAFNWNGLFKDEIVPIVGTGPFMATPAIGSEYLSGTQLTLVRNPNYHLSKDRPLLPNETSNRWEVKFDKLVFYFYDDAAAMSYAIKNNQIDVASFPPPEFSALRSQAPSNITFFDGPKVTQYWTEIGFNMNNAGPNPSRLDHNIRQALAMATNKSYIVENFYRGLADVGTTAIPPINSYWHYEPNATEKAQFRFDIAAANDLLNRSGYPVGTSGIRTVGATSAAARNGWAIEGMPLTYQMLIRREYPEEREIGMYLQQVWKTVGVDLQLSIQDEATMSTQVYAYTYDTMIWYWSGDVDPNYQLFALSKKAWNGWSDNKWVNQSYEANYSLSVTTMDPSSRRVYVDNAQRIHYLDAPYIIMAYPHQTYAWRTDTFAGWGDWAADPGRSIDSFWGANPLWFDLVPLHSFPGADTPPVIVDLYPNVYSKAVGKEVIFIAKTYDREGSNLSMYIDFGDGSFARQVIPGTNGLGTCEFGHIFTSIGYHTVYLWADDGNGTPGHNVSRSAYVSIIADLEPYISMFNVSSNPCAIGREVSFVVSAGDPDGDNLSYFITFGDGQTAFAPNETILDGGFKHTYNSAGNFTATVWASDGNPDPRHNASASITVHVVPGTPPYGLLIQISPNPATIRSVVSFRVGANDSDGDSLSFFIHFGDGLSGSTSTPPGPGRKEVVFTHTYSVVGNYTATVWADDGEPSIGHNISASAEVAVGGAGPSSVDYRWYDMFNVPFGPWDARRTLYYPGANYEAALSNSYPYIYEYYPDYAHMNQRLFSKMRLNITARDLPNVNIGNPVFLPLFGSAVGGLATLSWHMQYLDPAIVNIVYGSAATMYNDGWLINLTGVTTLDKDAAMAVTGMTSTQFDNFGSYWATNGAILRDSWAQWMVENQANNVFDINNMYGTPMQLIGFGLHAQKIADKIVFTIYADSWGMEALMARWLRSAFMPTEVWFEGFWMNATIGPSASNLDIDTGVQYALRAKQDSSGPYWSWEPEYGDYMFRSGMHQRSDFDAYFDVMDPEPVLDAGSNLYGQTILYDRAPSAWNLRPNETMSFTWPAGMQQFKSRQGPGFVVNITGNMTISSSEPRVGDALPPYLSNDSVSLNLGERSLSFKGPIDFWNWSRLQNSPDYSGLHDDWQTVGHLPRGAPLVKFGVDMANSSCPSAHFTVTPTSCNITSVLLFNASTSCDPKEPKSNLTYRWDFDGDGIMETSWTTQSTFHFQYSAPGHYSPILQVRNSKGYIGWVAGSVIVSDLPPLASFTVDAASGPQTHVFTFDASGCTDLEDSVGTLLVRWDWNGDGVWDTGWTAAKTATHQFTAPGTYTVHLQVNDSSGQVNVTTQQVVVLPLVVPEFPSVSVPILGVVLFIAASVFLRRRRSPSS